MRIHSIGTSEVPYSNLLSFLSPPGDVYELQSATLQRSSFDFETLVDPGGIPPSVRTDSAQSLRTQAYTFEDVEAKGVPDMPHMAPVPEHVFTFCFTSGPTERNSLNFRIIKARSPFTVYGRRQVLHLRPHRIASFGTLAGPGWWRGRCALDSDEGIFDPPAQRRGEGMRRTAQPIGAKPTPRHDRGLQGRAAHAPQHDQRHGRVLGPDGEASDAGPVRRGSPLVRSTAAGAIRRRCCELASCTLRLSRAF